MDDTECGLTKAILSWIVRKGLIVGLKKVREKAMRILEGEDSRGKQQ